MKMKDRKEPKRSPDLLSGITFLLFQPALWTHHKTLCL